MKWLNKTPKSIQDLWRIIEEAKDAYEIYKNHRRFNNKKCEKAYLKAGIFVGSQVKLKRCSDEKMIGAIGEVVKIQGQSVHIKIQNVIWRFKGYAPDFVEVIEK